MLGLRCGNSPFEALKKCYQFIGSEYVGMGAQSDELLWHSAIRLSVCELKTGRPIMID